MTEARQQALVDEEIIDTLDMTSRRLSKFTLFWYLKSLPELTLGTISTMIPVTIGALISLGLLIDWGIRRTFTSEQINEALAYDLGTIDETQLRRWLEDPRFVEWISGVSIWVIVGPLLLALAVVVGWFVVRALQWRRIRFGIEDGVIWMSGGLFATWTRRLPIVHVQSVEFRSTLLQRILTLRGVAISSAAPEGRDASIELLAVRRGVAAEFATIFQTAFGATISTPESGDRGLAPIASVGWKQLIVAAANSFEVRLSVFSLYVFYRVLGQFQSPRRWRDQVIHGVTKYAEDHHDAANIVLIGFGALLFFWFFSIIVYIATFARFRLRRNGQLALIEHGLLTRRWRTVLLPHVQALSFIESPAQQLMDSGSLRMTLPGTTRDHLERTMLLPAVSRPLAIGVLDQLFAELNPDVGNSLRELSQSLQRLPPSALRSYLLRWVWRLIPVSVALAVVFYLAPGGFGAIWGLTPLVVLGPIGALLGLVRFRDAGWALDEQGRLVVRERGLSRVTRSARRERLVWTRISRLRFFAGPNVTFVASVAGAGSRPGIKALLLGYGLAAQTDSRFRVRGLLDTQAEELVEQCSRHSGPR